MRGKVKYVDREVSYKTTSGYQNNFDVHDLRCSNTYAVLYPDTDGDELCVDIDEDDIRDYYDRGRITNALIRELSNDLHNVWIEFSEDDDGDYSLDGELNDYI